jgi:2-oxoglutarate dehydrogenase E1 component
MSVWSEFSEINRAYVEELYERYRRHPESVDPATRAMLASWAPPQAGEDLGLGEGLSIDAHVVVGVVNLAESIRRYGHLAARIDPLGTPPTGDPALVPETHGVTDADLRRLPASLVAGALLDPGRTALDAVEALRRVYCSSTGYDYAHIFVPEEREWLRQAAECARFAAPTDPIDPRALLVRLTEVETFERFLHRTFPGKTRFSIEGLDMLVPVLDEVIAEAAEAGIKQIIIGMAHRGRLNVMAHVLHKPYEQILAEFKDPVHSRTFREDMEWTGDVKYHLGATRAIREGRAVDLVISMPPNPSHLEAIDPVVEGMARAAGTSVNESGAPKFDPYRMVPILIHGDASFPGQGVVAETLNFYRLPGYTTGGTVHVITNNGLGFTAEPADSYSTLYASGLARGFKIPIVHVNSDDPEACVAAARLAFAYRQKFQRDFIIDLIGYRRHGHNEGDEPAFTQPKLYERIASQPTVRERYARSLVDRGTVEPSEPDALYRDHMERLQALFDGLDPEAHYVEPELEPPPTGAARSPATGVPIERLRGLNEALLLLPPEFVPHRKLVKARERRRHALDDPEARTVDWALAEELALASILEDGVAVRLTGEDVERGTFSHRHAVFHDPRTGASFCPLQGLPQARAAFEIHNSALTENAALGFEFGYNIQAPDRLVVWEAQYGDFVNGAQVIIDEFITSARSKWGQKPSLVMLLPHGFEGQGPDHASARPERFLQLAADVNIRVINCTSAAQYFHVLRRQVALLRSDPLPLIVLSPKSLLRHPLTASTPRELAQGRWERVIEDDTARRRAADIRRLVLCSGKIYVDLVTADGFAAVTDLAVSRLEQLYPFPAPDVSAALTGFPKLREVVWLQEEPENMGAWDSVSPHLAALVPSGVRLRLIARPRSASPAEGSAARHAVSQRKLVEEALGSGL